MKQRSFEFESEAAQQKFLNQVFGPKNSERASKAKEAMLAAKEASNGVKYHKVKIGNEEYKIGIFSSKDKRVDNKTVNFDIVTYGNGGWTIKKVGAEENQGNRSAEIVENFIKNIHTGEFTRYVKR